VRENERARPFFGIIREADLFAVSQRDNRQVKVEQRAVALDLVLLAIDAEPDQRLPAYGAGGALVNRRLKLYSDHCVVTQIFGMSG
ncbi:MAG: hypothetical protein ACREX8_09785, partial [Gammaproteobacteria bacterium]